MGVAQVRCHRLRHRRAGLLALLSFRLGPARRAGGDGVLSEAEEAAADGAVGHEDGPAGSMAIRFP